jgi:hypothetical protein
MAEHGALPEREDGRRPARLTRSRNVADGEDSCVPPDQPASVVPLLDVARREPQGLQLRVRHVAVLPGGKLGDATSVVSIPHAGV